MLERFFDLSFGRRLLIYGGIVGIIAFLYYFFPYLSLSTQIAEKQARLHDLEAERAKLQATLKDREKLKIDLAEVEARFKQATTQLPEQKEIPELLRQVSNLGRDSGLEITLFRQQPERLQDLYAEVPVEMSVRGSYHQVALFFEKVRHLDRIVNVSDITIKNPQLTDTGLQVDVSFFATTYRFLTEEERAQIAKQKEEAKKKSGNAS
jgi:type IV pilus assembly protein PilO